MTRMKAVKVQRVGAEHLTIERRKYKNGFRYYDGPERKIADLTVVKRIRKLVIPPMWSEVKVCNQDNGHIQAVGRDLKGRKQYIYHTEWERLRQEAKFKKMSAFGIRLSDMRKKAALDISQNKWCKTKMAALLVMILDETGIRIGNKQYADRNGTYGLTTLRRRHIHLEDDHLAFEYKGKSNKIREVVVEDPDLIKYIKKTASLPGYELFRYRTKTQNFESIDSEDVNDYIRETMGDEFSSKDFRTWVASRLAIEFYPEAKEQKCLNPRKKFANILVKMVAEELGNTPSVCRSHYIHPVIMDFVNRDTLPFEVISQADNALSELTDSERLLLKLIS